MRSRVRLGDFVVQELAQLPLASKGDYAIYEVEKQNVTTLQVQTHVAAQLHRRQADVQAPALKDKKAIATQHLCVRGSGPAELNGPGYRARFVGRSPRPLRPSDLSGNRFTITLRDMSPGQVRAVRERLEQVTRYGLPNYFDKQRFGSHISHPQAPDNFIGKTILRRDAQGAVRAYLSYPFAGDPQRVRAFKTVARERWGEWAFLLDEAPRPSNYRSLLTYLKDHPQDYRKALNLIPRRLLSLYLVAYQSYLWNQIASAYLAHRLASASPPPTLTVLDLALTVYHELSPAQHAALSALSVSLPGHRAVYQDPALARIVRETLAREGLKLNDLKARILKRAYLPKGKRALLLHPTDVTCDEAQKDEHFAGRQALRFSFSLPRGAFATWVLRTLGVAG
jgi:tRNA pseudouridine13 synthase